MSLLKKLGSRLVNTLSDLVATTVWSYRSGVDGVSWCVPHDHGTAARVRMTIWRVGSGNSLTRYRQITLSAGERTSPRLPVGMYHLVTESGTEEKGYVITSQRCEVCNDGYRTFRMWVSNIPLEVPQADGLANELGALHS